MTPKLRVGLAAVALSLSLDQLAKYLVARRVGYGEALPVFDGFFYLTHVRNTGTAFSLFTAGDASLRRAVFIAVSVVGIGLLACFFRQIGAGDRRSALALGLIVGGALGNLVDRVFRFAVVDFLRFRLSADYVWPDFNLADSCIVVGTALFLLELLDTKPRRGRTMAP